MGKKIISELEDIILGVNGNLYERANDWIQRITTTERVNKVFYKNLYYAMKIVESSIEENKNDFLIVPRMQFEKENKLSFSGLSCHVEGDKSVVYNVCVSPNEVTLRSPENQDINITINIKDNEEPQVACGNKLSKQLWQIINKSITASQERHKILLFSKNLVVIEGFNDIVYAILFTKAFEIICRSILSGEYAMDDSFSKGLQKMAKSLRTISSLSSLRTSNSFIYFSKCTLVLSQIIDEYNLFCVLTDAQVDKDPSAVLCNTAEYSGYHKYEVSLNSFLSVEGDFLDVNPLLLHFFQAFLDMARIDQNYFFSKNRLYKLLYLKELLDLNTDEGKGIWRVWDRYQKEKDFLKFDDVKEMLCLANLKNEFLIKKILGSCSHEVKDLTYVGQSKSFVFNPRKCQDLERGGDPHPELLLFKKVSPIANDGIDGLLSLYSEYIEGCDNLKDFDEYEKNYINAIHERNEKDEKNYINRYYYEILKSQTSRTNKDIRHYNTKVLEMARDAIFDTAEIRCWIKHHRHDFKEEEGFNQIKKVLMFINNRYEDNHVCYDYETLVEYAYWCISFLEIVADKTPTHESDRPSQIEEALLLIETLNRLIDKLINSIEGKNYSLPYASKFRGCFFYYSTENQPSLIRVFAGQSQSDDKFTPEKFESFIDCSDNYKDERKNIIFIASSYIPPLNYEKLKTQREELKAKTQKLRNEIHAQYFNRLREYIKEDSEKQLEDNRRSVVQILGIFAAFLALTTVALTGAVSSKETTIPFHTIMLSFSLCISVFVALIYLISYSRAHRKMELRLLENKIYQQWLHDETNKTISIIKREFSVQKDNNDQLLANAQNSIKELLEELQNCNSNINIENTGLKNTFQEINILLNKIQDNLSNFQINAKPTKRKSIYKHFLSTKRNISPSERIINDLLKNVTKIKELTIKDKFSTIHERIKDLEQVRILEDNIQKTCDNIQKIIPKKNAPRKTRLNFAEQLLIIVILILLGGTIISICYYEKKESYPPQQNNNTTRTDDNRDCDLTFSNNQTIHVLQMNQDNKKNVHE